MGFPPVLTSTAPGDSDGQIDLLTADNVPGGLLVSISARPGYSQYFVIILDGNVIDTVFVQDSMTVPVFVTTDGTHTLIAQPNGEWSNAFTDAVNAAIQYYGADSGRTIRFVLTPTLQYLQDDTSAVTVTATAGAVRNRNLNLDTEGRANWATFDFTSTDLGGGNFQLDITARGITVATGTGAAGSIVALPVNGSDLTVTATVTGAGTGTCWIRWPESYKVFWGSDSATISDDGTSNSFVYTTPILPGTSYPCHTVQYDDNDNVSSSSGTVTITLDYFPDAPTNEHYVSGDATSTDIAWTAVPFADHYNVYDSADNADNFLDTFAPSQVVTGTTATLTSALTPPFTRSVIVRAVYLGHVEQNLNVLTINYDAGGAYIPPLPNSPTLFGSPNATGRSFACTASYDPANQEVAPDAIALYAWPAGTTPDWTTVYDAAVYTDDGGAMVFSLDSGTLPSGWGNGLVSFGLRAVTGGVDDGNTVIYGPVEITDTGTAAPTAIIEAGA